MKRLEVILSILVLVVASSLAPAAIRIVRTGTTYATVQAAVNAAIAGDTIEVDSGTYTQSAGWATVNKANLIIRGVGATRPILDAAGSSLSGKAIFIITGSGTGVTVENLEFKNAKCASLNGAGIRQECANLTVRNCYFHDNEDGILANAVTGSTILVEYSEFDHNGYGDGYSHNMYIGAVDQFTLRYCYVHDAVVGHEVKTRALKNFILYNRIGNEGGNGAYEVSAPQGGTTYVIGNMIEQSSTGGNATIIDYKSEAPTNPDLHLYVVNNTIVNYRGSCTFVRNYAATNALLQNNIFQGNGTVLSGVGTQTTNWPTTNAYLVNAAGFDYHLTASSTGAINAGTAPGTGIDGFAMTPVSEYSHPRSYTSRGTNGTIDIGAYEYMSGSLPTVQFSSASSNGNESTTSASIPVTLSTSSSSTVTVNYAVTGGTATGSGTDYALASGQLTFVPGDTSENIPVTVNNDTMDENDETIVITLSSPVNATLGGTISHTYTILDNDNTPTVQFSAASSSGSESVTSVTLPVTLSAASGKTVTVNYSLTGGSATSGTDFTLTGTQLTFNPGVTSQNIPITVTNDTAAESNETIIVGLNSPSNATLGGTTSHTYTINDNDSTPPVVQFQVTSSNSSEATTPASLVVTLDHSYTSTVTVDFKVTSSIATPGADYSVTGATNTVVALKRNSTLTQGGAIDARFTGLGDGNVVLSTVKDAQMYSGGNGRYMNYGTITQVQGNTIMGWDLSAYAYAAINKAQLRLRSSQGNTAMQIAPVKSHDWVEGNKNADYPGNSPAAPGVTFANPSATNTTNSGPLGWGTNSDSMFSTTSDGQDLYTLVNFTSMPGGVAWCVAEMTSYVQDWVAGAKPNYGVLIASGNHMPYLSEGSAADQPVLFLDYTAQKGTLTFVPGDTSESVSLTIVNDTTVESNETIVVTLSNPTNSTLGANTVHTYTINNND